MGHTRLNERETNPNPHINFITALPVVDAVAEEEARQLLRALAAQVRPVMKTHGFAVNSFEEYEFNKVFAGRNWNNGEVLEIVLRGASGRFLPTPWLLGTLCHELAHVKHMNHGAEFQALFAQIRAEVRVLQNKGYYGDGYWSSGTRLADSPATGGRTFNQDDLPEYMCGGAQNRARPSSLKRRVDPQIAGPSNHSGAQTVKRRKAGTRVTAQGVFKGEGQALNADISDNDKKVVGSGFRKKAGSKRARDERAQIAQQRLKSLLRKSADGSKEGPSLGLDPDDGPHETDRDRRQMMLDTMDQADLWTLKSSISNFWKETRSHTLSPFEREPLGAQHSPNQSCDDEGGHANGPTKPQHFQSTPTSLTSSSGKGEEAIRASPTSSGFLAHRDSLSPDAPPASKKRKLSPVPAVQAEIQHGDKEAISPAKIHSASTSRNIDTAPIPQPDQEIGWPCLVCTLSNAPMHLACAACGTPRGESKWQDSS